MSSDWDKYFTTIPEHRRTTPQPAARFQARPDQPSEHRQTDWQRKLQDQDDEQPLGARINASQSIQDLVEMVEAYTPSQQSAIASGIYAAIMSLCPWHGNAFLNRLRASPICASTADRFSESMRFMQPGTGDDP